MTAPRRFVIIPAGGLGTRAGLSYPKQLFPLNGTTVIERTIGLFSQNLVYVPVPESFLSVFEEKIGGSVHVLAGGPTRFDSVKRAFQAIADLQDRDLVLIHDAVRPFLDKAGLDTAWTLAEQKGALIYAARATDTIKQTDGSERVVRTLNRKHIFHAQTPQIFRASLLRRAYDAYDPGQGEPPTDEAQLLEMAGIPVHIFESQPSNRKLTHGQDFARPEAGTARVGTGYDVHRFDAGRPLYLGGVLIPEAPGLAGHSDADAAVHALIDALLGAAGLGDIGQWFPDTDPRWKGARSTLLLAEVWNELKALGYRLGNADLTIQAQTPRLAPHLPAMRAALGAILETESARINVKATTTEGLGFVGRKEGIAVQAVAILCREEGS